MTGRELIAELLTHDIDVPVVIASGQEKEVLIILEDPYGTANPEIDLGSA